VSAPLLIGMFTSRIRYFLAGSFLISAWLSYPAGLFQTIGDLALEIVSGVQILSIIIYLTYVKKILSVKFTLLIKIYCR